MTELAVFVSHSFSADQHAEGLAAYRSTVEQVLGDAALRLARTEAVSFEVIFEARQPGKSLPSQIRADLDRCDIAVVDLSGVRPNVLYELGWLHRSATPTLLVRSYEDADLGEAIPSDIADSLVGHYRRLDDLNTLLSGAAEAALTKALERRRSGGQRLSLWFPPDVDQVNVVCAPEPEQSRFARAGEPNYVYVDSLEDRDALLEVVAQVSRSFPKATLVRHSSAQVGPDLLRSNLVVLGGPGFSPGEGNAVARNFLDACEIPLEYLDDPERMVWNGASSTPEWRSDQSARVDFGYFAALRNPYNPKNRVVLAQGILTAGTLGAVLAFSDRTESAHNWDSLGAAAASRGRQDDLDTLSFDARFQVSVLPSGLIAVPQILPDAIRILGR